MVKSLHSLCFLFTWYNLCLTLTSTPSIFLCTNKGKRFKASVPDLIGLWVLAVILHLLVSRKLSLGFPKSSAKTQDVPGVSVHTPLPTNTVMRMSQVLSATLETALQLPFPLKPLSPQGSNSSP